ncbi:MAG: methyl-accepting chemotaxis protein [Burkholderiaceae bacterium]
MLGHLRLRQQLGWGFGVVVLLFSSVLAVTGWIQLSLLGDIRTIENSTLPNVLVVSDMDLARSDVQQFLTDVAATRGTDAYAEAEAAAERFRKGVDHFRRQYVAAGQTDHVQQLDAVARDFDHFYRSGRDMAQIYIDQGLEAGNLLMKGPGGFDEASVDLMARMDVLRERELAQARAIAAAASAEGEQAEWVVLVGGLLAAAVATGAAMLIGNFIHGQLGGEVLEATDVARRVAKGDLSFSIDVPKGDNGSLMAHMAVMQDSLAQVVRQVRQGSDAVATASEQIAMGNNDLSSRTESQASALEETAASMDELGSTVSSNAGNAREANRLAQDASGVARRGGDAVAEVVSTMRGISEASRRIADIINVIDGIAFQTNILALNAAVEAARAGEQGRGFAVVASEVRSLAQRSAQAAHEIKVLIEDSVSQVEQGAVQVDRAGSTMHEVVDSIGRVTAIVGEISTASTQQSAGVSQMVEAVGQMDHATQQNAAMVEEMAAAASGLHTQARDLVQAVAVFRLDERQPAFAPA